MPKKDRKIKNLKSIKTEKDATAKYFYPPVEKRIIFKDFSSYFNSWTSWQRKILLCRCTSQSSLSLLISFSTAMEPVFHRDYQIINVGSYQSKLIDTFSPRSQPKREEVISQTAEIKINAKNEKWHLPLKQQNNEIFVRDKIASAFIMDRKNKSYFDEIELNEIPMRRQESHTHTMNKKRDSVSTLDFFWKYDVDKVGALGSFVKVQKQSTQIHHKNTVSQYKHKTWFLPPINQNQPLERASKRTLLISFKDVLKKILHSYNKWSNAEQGDFILTLLKLCSPEELFFLGNCIQQRLNDIGNINRLSDTLLLKVFSYLDTTDLYNCSQTCHRWNYLANHNKIWKQRSYDLAREYNQYPVLQYLETISKNLSWKNIYQDLKNTVQQLVDVFVLQSTTALTSHEKDEDDVPSVASEEELEDETTEGSIASTSSSSLGDYIEVIHLSPSKSFATLNSETTKDILTPSVLSNTAENACTKEESQADVPEESSEEADLAFDVRPKLVQPSNRVRSSSKVLRKTSNLSECEYVHVPVQGVISLKRVRKLQGHLEAVLCIQFDKKRVMTGSLDRTVRLWDVRSGRNFYKLKGHKGGVRCLQFDHEYIVTGSWDTTVMVWHVSRFSLLHTITEHKGSVSCLELNSNSLITGSHDGTVCIFERDTWLLLRKLDGHKGPVSSMVLVSDEELLTGSHDMRVLLWDLNTGCQLKEFRQSRSPILTVKICGELVVAGCLDGTLNFWNKSTTCFEGCVQAHNGALHAICFLKDRFITGGADGLVKEWDLGTCTCVRSLTGHTGPVLCVRASPKRIISGSTNGNVRIWDLACALQQVGGPYDEMNKIVVPSETINEREWREKRSLIKQT